MPADTLPDSVLGQRLGQYRIVREVGRGGMGVVYEARHERLGQLAAVKMLSSRLAAEPRAIERFFQEAQACALIEHEGVPKIFDFGQTEQGSPYILMEFLRGESLRLRLRQRPHTRLALTEAIRIGRQVASTLTAAHARGIIHRDLKPENIILIPDSEAPGGERAKVLDFGIAKLIDAAPDISSQDRVLGTPTYMAPEQCLGDEITDGRTDVYGLGILLYEMLMGQPPFVGEREDLLRLQIFEQPAPLRGQRPDLSEALEFLILRMLSKSLGERPAMPEVVLSLSEVRSEPEPPPPAATPAAPSSGRHTATETGTGPATRAPLALPPLRRRTPPPRRRTYALAACGALAAAVALAVALTGRARSSKMVLVAGNTFNMGSSTEEINATFSWAQRSGCPECPHALYEREQPVRRVQLASFLMDATEVSCAALAQWLNQQPDLRVVDDRQVFHHTTLLIDLYSAYGYSGIVYQAGHYAPRHGMERRPVVLVTWDTAQRYCQSQGKRLPTEAEWEFAARDRQGFRFPWGDDEPQCSGVVFGRGPSGPCATFGSGTRDVGTAEQDRSSAGIFDLGGNVAEWVYDAYRQRYKPCAGSCINPRADDNTPEDGGADQRVVRGGAWFRKAESVRAAGRSHRRVSEVAGDIGFRCVRSVQE